MVICTSIKRIKESLLLAQNPEREIERERMGERERKRENERE